MHAVGEAQYRTLVSDFAKECPSYVCVVCTVQGGVYFLGLTFRLTEKRRFLLAGRFLLPERSRTTIVTKSYKVVLIVYKLKT